MDSIRNSGTRSSLRKTPGPRIRSSGFEIRISLFANLGGNQELRVVFFSGLVPAAYPETSRTVLSPAGNAEDAREDESKSKQASQKVLFENKRFPPFQQ